MMLLPCAAQAYLIKKGINRLAKNAEPFRDGNSIINLTQLQDNLNVVHACCHRGDHRRVSKESKALCGSWIDRLRDFHTQSVGSSLEEVFFSFLFFPLESRVS